MSPTSRRWPGAAIGTAPRVYRVQDNYVAQWGLNDSDKPWPAGVNPKPPAEYTRPLKGLTDQAARHPRSLCAGGRLRRRLAGRLQSQGGLGDACPLLWQRRRRPRPRARHGHRRRALCRDRPWPAPARPQHRAGRAGGRRHRPLQHAPARDRSRSASTRTRRNMCRSQASGWRATCPWPAVRRIK